VTAATFSRNLTITERKIQRNSGDQKQ